ncbi:NAD(P)H-dependent oxidoreductase [Pseudomonas sp. USTB-Z]|jgi:chromate reductase|uniref:NADPH-dependent FMN reductase n=1 Tax=Pseudomonas sp. USTB-Z TaxID=2794351 RepID=UPI001C82FF74|nr:NAD(P)H-dependent oxidoreductase [Pseudomonas sp. USTB-Z]MBX6689846.1 NAD(P)H-dependent oxidoreductase [Pseudomonas sp. USTB-Z]
MKRYQFIGLCGSLRKHSAHEQILNTIAEELLPSDSSLTLYRLHNLPPYNEDHDGPSVPDAVLELRQAVLAASGIVIGCPEYNHGMSGVLKNALDWLSRPHGKSVLTAKPVLTFTASPAFTGGVRAQQQLNETLWAVSAELTRYPQIVIGSVHSKLSNGRLVDESTRNYLRLGVKALSEMM